MARLTVRLNVVEWLIPPPDPVIIIVYVPVGVDDEVEIVNVLENVGLPEDGL